MDLGFYLKYRSLLSYSNETRICSTDFRKTQEPNFMKIRLVRNELFHGDSRTNRHNEANSGVSQFCENAYKLHSRRNRGMIQFWIQNVVPSCWLPNIKINRAILLHFHIGTKLRLSRKRKDTDQEQVSTDEIWGQEKGNNRKIEKSSTVRNFMLYSLH